MVRSHATTLAKMILSVIITFSGYSALWVVKTKNRYRTIPSNTRNIEKIAMLEFNTNTLYRLYEMIISVAEIMSTAFRNSGVYSKSTILLLS